MVLKGFISKNKERLLLLAVIVGQTVKSGVLYLSKIKIK
jgi:hypothetical protein